MDTAFVFAPPTLPLRAHGFASRALPRPARIAGKSRAVIRAQGGSGPPPMPPDAKAAAAKGEPVKYWQGEWVCVDCGFVYGRKKKVKFENLAQDWKCPQCNAPKRRFAKKAGDFIQETETTSNAPIVIFSIAGLIGMIIFGVWAASSL